MLKKVLLLALSLIVLTGFGFAQEKGDVEEKTTEKNPIVKFETNHGDFYFEVFLNETPIHAQNFLSKVDAGKYDSLTFHRVVKNFFVQGGDPTGSGSGSMGADRLADEKSPYPQVEGTVAMARGGAGASNCQFYINLKDNTRLDEMGFSSFAKVVHGMDIVRKIEAVETTGPPNAKTSPVETVYMIKLSRVDELPEK